MRLENFNELKARPETATQPGLRYVPGLDGARAVALLLVMLAHWGKLQMGWVSINFFFVLSGFLITGILLDTREALPLGPYLRRYLARRTLRVFPLYYAYLALLTLVYIATGLPEGLGQVLPSLYTYTFNIHQALQRTGVGEGMLVGHLWSLSLEEQFYLAWPFVIYFLPRRPLLGLLWAIVLAGPLVRTVQLDWFLAHYEGRVFEAVWSAYLNTPTHLDALALGALLALTRLPDKLSHPGRWALGLLALTLMAGLACLFLMRAEGIYARFTSLGYQLSENFAQMNVWAFTLWNLTAAGLICFLAHPRPAQPVQLARRFFEHPWLVALGKRSYGGYIWHFAVMVSFDWALKSLGIDRFGRSSAEIAVGTALFLPYLALVALAAFTSYRFIEMPFLRLKGRFS